MPVQKIATPRPIGSTPQDQTWRHYSRIIDKFRNLCQPDATLFKQAENRIAAKRVVDEWERGGRQFVDASTIAKRMVEYQLDEEDQRHVDALYRSKLAFRERLSCALGKLPGESWDTFFYRHSATRKVPNTVRQWELAQESAA